MEPIQTSPSFLVKLVDYDTVYDLSVYTSLHLHRPYDTHVEMGTTGVSGWLSTFYDGGYRKEVLQVTKDNKQTKRDRINKEHYYCTRVIVLFTLDPFFKYKRWWTILVKPWSFYREHHKRDTKFFRLTQNRHRKQDLCFVVMTVHGYDIDPTSTSQTLLYPVKIVIFPSIFINIYKNFTNILMVFNRYNITARIFISKVTNHYKS